VVAVSSTEGKVLQNSRDAHQLTFIYTHFYCPGFSQSIE